VWSPDGTQIAFISDRDGDVMAYGDVVGLVPEVYVMNADGTGQTNLTNNPTADDEPAWSPDGSEIAFRSYRDGNHEIYVMDADGTGQTNLTNDSASDIDHAWLP
jgi:TolB protein